LTFCVDDYYQVILFPNMEGGAEEVMLFSELEINAEEVER